MDAWEIAWQRGVYESGRSRMHWTRDGYKTACGIEIPQGRNIEILGGNDGTGTCERCMKSVFPKESDLRIRR